MLEDVAVEHEAAVEVLELSPDYHFAEFIHFALGCFLHELWGDRDYVLHPGGSVRLAVEKRTGTFEPPSGQPSLVFCSSGEEVQ